MAILEDQPRSTAPARKSPAPGQGRVVYENAPRAPRGRKAVYVETLTQARLIQAAAELGRNADDMAEAAIREYLKREATALFEREFAQADQSSSISVKRWEFERDWKPPSWNR